MKIKGIVAEEILDSRGNPTISCSVRLECGAVGRASVPSGASTGSHEAHELRDTKEERYKGRGVLTCIKFIDTEISEALTGKDAENGYEIDRTLCELDGTENKSRLGANTILSVSLATARAAAACMNIPLYRYLGGLKARRLPTPMFNVINGGAHAKNGLDTQEFMICPVGIGSFTEALRCGSEIYHTLARILESKGHSTGVGDEGGFAPNISSDEEAIELLTEAIEKSGYSDSDVKIALDVAASEWKSKSGYTLKKSGKYRSGNELVDHYEMLVNNYPVFSIEDGAGEDDIETWSTLTKRLGKRVRLVGDDLFVTNTTRLSDGARAGIANSILIKPNQIGTLSEVFAVTELARAKGYGFIISHRSGETEDPFIADLAVALGAPFIKSGAPRGSERLSKYNRLMHIEKELGCGALGTRERFLK